MGKLLLLFIAMPAAELYMLTMKPLLLKRIFRVCRKSMRWKLTRIIDVKAWQLCLLRQQKMKLAAKVFL